MKLFKTCRKLVLLFLTVFILLIMACNKENVEPNDCNTNILCGTFTDPRDDKTYNHIKIGTQTWMAENLAYLPVMITPSGGSFYLKYYYVYGCYDSISVSVAKNTDNYKTYGVLYNWEAAKSSCPQGWHLPNDDEWKTLEIYLGMSSSEAEKDGYRNSGFIGEKLKSTSGWSFNGNGNDSIGFNALPAGYRFDDGEFYRIGHYADFWTSTADGSPKAWVRYLYQADDGIRRSSYYRTYGFSVRCIMN